MEVLAFTHVAVQYEDPNPEPQLQNFKIPSSAWVGLVGMIVFLSALQAGGPEKAMAASVYGPGSQGEGVKAIQRVLGVQQTGFFGNTTEAYVLQFQRDRGLQVDGLVGPETAGALGLAAIVDGSSVRPVSTGTSGTYRVSTRSGTGVLLRTGPGLNYGVAGGASDGAGLSLTTARRYADGITWGQLTDGRWVATDYLAYREVSTPVPSSGGARVVARTGLTIRSGPGLGYGSIGFLGNGSSVSLTSERVYRNGYTWGRLVGGGWVATDYIS